jgi:hypothetical protein
VDTQRKGAQPHRVGELQPPSLRLEHDVQATALEVRAVGGTGDLEGWGQLRGAAVGTGLS